MTFTEEQEAFIASNRYVNVEANRALFPVTPTHAEYRQHRRDMKRDGKEVLDVRNIRGLPPLTQSLPKITLPDLFEETDGEDLWQAVQSFQATHRQSVANQIMTDINIGIETDKPFGIVFMSDWHIGGLGTDHEALMRDIELINSCPNLAAYVGGDPVDNFIPEKLAHVARDSQIVSPSFQWKMFRHAINELHPSLLAVGRGNHDGWTQRNAGIEGIEQALRGIPVLHTAEDTYIDLTVGEQTYVIYRKHRPLGSSRIHKTAGVKRSYDFGKRLFDVGVTEHHHEAALNIEKRHNQYRLFITTGSYKVDDLHSREWGFVNGGIGTPTVIFYPHRKKIVPYMSIEDAIEHLER